MLLNDKFHTNHTKKIEVNHLCINMYLIQLTNFKNQNDIVHEMQSPNVHKISKKNRLL